MNTIIVVKFKELKIYAIKNAQSRINKGFERWCG